MRRFRKTPVVAWAVVLAVLLPGLDGLGESVLCFGADGHVAVEAAVSPGACSAASVFGDTSSYNPERELSRGDHCGPCVDVASLSGPWVSTTFSSHLSEHTAWSAMSPSRISLQGDELPATAGKGPLAFRLYPPPSAPCAFLRTTILLI